MRGVLAVFRASHDVRAWSDLLPLYGIDGFSSHADTGGNPLGQPDACVAWSSPCSGALQGLYLLDCIPQLLQPLFPRAP